mmetsp:Transcript_27119/g.85315  ORF Transcript_27119/g.85315 Transcript_27119/m.85315 type:complete len:213 (-) Transcript_27119:2439-3077(-)
MSEIVRSRDRGSVGGLSARSRASGISPASDAALLAVSAGLAGMLEVGVMPSWPKPMPGSNMLPRKFRSTSDEATLVALLVLLAMLPVRLMVRCGTVKSLPPKLRPGDSATPPFRLPKLCLRSKLSLRSGTEGGRSSALRLAASGASFSGVSNSTETVFWKCPTRASRDSLRLLRAARSSSSVLAKPLDALDAERGGAEPVCANGSTSNESSM